MTNKKAPTEAEAKQDKQTSADYTTATNNVKIYLCAWCKYFSQGIRRRTPFLFCRFTGDTVTEFDCACSFFEVKRYE